jgi:Aerotolerance regulator N-terminal/von Willebrand factor type A domain
MNFLAPLFLLGGIAIAAPIIFHLIRRTTREHTLFSSLMFLLPTPPRLTRRSRLENWLLLLLRCLALGLLALGFARPFLKQSSPNDPSGGPAKRIVVLLDVSASMRRTGLFADARGRAESTLRSAGPGDQIAVFTYDRSAQPVLSFGEWNAAAFGERAALAASRLAMIEPGWASTNLGSALITAAEALADSENDKSIGARQIVLITDLQGGSRLEALQAYEWPKGVELIVDPLKARNPTNAGLQLLADTADADRQAATSVRVRVSNATESTREQFKVGWTKTVGGELVGATVDTYVPPGQSRVVSLPVASAGGSNAIALRGDDEDFDNTVFVIPPAQQKLSIAYFGSENPDDVQQPLFFLKRALPDTPRLAISVTPQAAGAVLTPEVMASSLFVVTDALAANQAALLREQALGGKTILFAAKNTAAAAALGPLLGLDALPAEEVKPPSYAMLGEIDFQHPLFTAFADPRYSDFTKIHFWKYRRLDAAAIPGARVLAKFDRGDPALLEVPVGKGRVLVLTSGWNPDDSQFAVSSKFVPMLFSILELSGALAAPVTQRVVGDPLPLPADRNENLTVRPPDGKTAPALSADAKVFAATTQPGIYRIENAGRVQEFAVNLDAAESRTTPLPLEELERLGAPLARKKAVVAANAPAREALLQGSAAESRQKLWRWFIIATLLVLLAESALAGWTVRKPALSGQPGTP